MLDAMLSDDIFRWTIHNSFFLKAVFRTLGEDFGHPQTTLNCQDVPLAPAALGSGRTLLDLLAPSTVGGSGISTPKTLFSSPIYPSLTTRTSTFREPRSTVSGCLIVALADGFVPTPTVF